MPTFSLTLCELTETGLPSHESYSPFCLKVHRALRLADLPYTRRHGAHPGVFSALYAPATVPVLLVRDDARGEERAIGDSTRIVAHLATLGHPLDGGGDVRTRAEVLLWEELADTSLNGFLVAARWADARNWPATKQAYFAAMPAILRAFIPDRQRKSVLAALRARDVLRQGEAACWERFEEMLDLLEARAPQSGWWIGERATVADVAIFAQLHSLRTPLTRWQAARLAERPTLTRYLDRVDAATCVMPTAGREPRAGCAWSPLSPCRERRGCARASGGP